MLSKSVKALILLRAGINGARIEISTKEYIEPIKWNSNRQEVKEKNEGVITFNCFIYNIPTLNYSIVTPNNGINVLFNPFY